jgi:hypothetical protein
MVARAKRRGARKCGCGGRGGAARRADLRRVPLVVPRRTQIAGLVITIECGEALAAVAECCGQWRSGEQLILIDSSTPRESQESTYLHELIEAVNTVAELGLEHRQIEALAGLLHQALTTHG